MTDDLIARLRERALALGRAKNPSKAIDDMRVHFLQAAEALETRDKEIAATEQLYRAWHDRALKAEAEIAEIDRAIKDICAVLSDKESVDDT